MRKFFALSIVTAAALLFSVQIFALQTKVPEPVGSLFKRYPITDWSLDPQTHNLLIVEKDSVVKFLKFEDQSTFKAVPAVAQSCNRIYLSANGYGVMTGHSTDCVNPVSGTAESYSYVVNFLNTGKCTDDYRVYHFDSTFGYAGGACAGDYGAACCYADGILYTYIKNFQTEDMRCLKFYLPSSAYLNYNICSWNLKSIYLQNNIPYLIYSQLVSYSRVKLYKYNFLDGTCDTARENTSNESNNIYGNYLISILRDNNMQLTFSSLDLRNFQFVKNSDGETSIALLAATDSKTTIYERDHHVAVDGMKGGWDYETNEWDNSYVPTYTFGFADGIDPNCKIDLINGDTTALVKTKDKDNSVYRCGFKNGNITKKYELVYSEKEDQLMDRYYRFSNDYYYSIKLDTLKYVKYRNDTAVNSKAFSRVYKFYDVRSGQLAASFSTCDSSFTQLPDTLSIARNFGSDSALIISGYNGRNFINNGGEKDYGLRAYLLKIGNNTVLDTFNIINYSADDSLKFYCVSGNGRILGYALNSKIENDSIRENTTYYKLLAENSKIISYCATFSDSVSNGSTKLRLSVSPSIIENLAPQLYKIKIAYLYKYLSYGSWETATNYYNWFMYKDKLFTELPQEILTGDSQQTKIIDKYLINAQKPYAQSPSGKYICGYHQTDKVQNVYLFEVDDKIILLDTFSLFRPSDDKSQYDYVYFLTDSTLKFGRSLIINIADKSNIYGYQYYVGFCTPIDENYFWGDFGIIYKWTEKDLSGVEAKPQSDANSCCFSIFPTPANNLLNVEITSGENNYGGVKGKIIDMQGRTVKEIFSQSKNFEINTAEFPVGSYIIEIENPAYGRNEFRIFSIIR